MRTNRTITAMAGELRWLILETSQRRGALGLAQGDRVLAAHPLDEARRHARDLVPTIKTLLAQLGWQLRDLAGVMVSRGPGSYTGLRVGIMSAKTLAYASGCKLLGIDTFDAIARQAPQQPCAVLADAQQDKIYLQTFPGSLTIVPFAQLETLPAGTMLLGPGLEGNTHRVPGHLPIAPQECWMPRLESLLAVGLGRTQYDDPFRLEPLYHRPSSAEEIWDRRK